MGTKNTAGKNRSKKDRDIFINLISPKEVLDIIEKLPIPKLNYAEVPPINAVGEIAAKDIYANISVPHYNAAAMDGIAVKAKDTFGASELNPKSIPPEKYIKIDTGQPIPEDFDTVIPEEFITFDQNQNAVIHSSFYPWENIRIIGEDIVKGELLISQNSIISEKAIPLLLAGGIWRINVFEKPKALIIPTGNEIVTPPVNHLEDGQIIDYDSTLIAKLLEKWGCKYKISEVIPDDPEVLKNKILTHQENYDFICIIAGSSAGSKDFTKNVLREIGNVYVHGVKMMPGKPFSLATVFDKVIFGIPGFPASAFFSAVIFIKSYLKRFIPGIQKEKKIKCKLSNNVSSKLGYDEIIRVTVAEINNETRAIPLKRGASVYKSIYDSDGYFIIPENSEGFSIGQEIFVNLINHEFDFKNNIILIGSNDISIDYLKSLIKIKYPEYNLISINKGSLGGLASLKNNEAHFAPTHLFDPETGDYNISYIKDLFGKEKILLLGVARRTQGIIVNKGNPLNIKGIKDITRGKFINRQKGSGTRILFDYLLNKYSIDKRNIDGYDFELYTHMAICNFIKKGYADSGIGIKSAADAFDLDFIPIGHEDYELAFYESSKDDTRFEILFDTVASKSFKDKLIMAGGYETSITGRIRKV